MEMHYLRVNDGRWMRVPQQVYLRTRENARMPVVLSNCSALWMEPVGEMESQASGIARRGVTAVWSDSKWI